MLQLMQMAVFVLYSIHIRSEKWFPYFKILINKECDALWMWSENELRELQDEELAKRALKWKEVVNMVAANITPKLNSFGMFAGKDLDPETLVSLFFLLGWGGKWKLGLVQYYFRVALGISIAKALRLRKT